MANSAVTVPRNRTSFSLESPEGCAAFRPRYHPHSRVILPLNSTSRTYFVDLAQAGEVHLYNFPYLR